MIENGFKRVNLWVPAEHVPILKELKAQLVDGSEDTFEALRDFVTVSYRAMLTDPECDDLDRQVARSALRELGVAPAASGASEDAASSPADGTDGTA